MRADRRLVDPALSLLTQAAHEIRAGRHAVGMLDESAARVGVGAAVARAQELLVEARAIAPSRRVDTALRQARAAAGIASDERRRWSYSLADRPLVAAEQSLFKEATARIAPELLTAPNRLARITEEITGLIADGDFTRLATIRRQLAQASRELDRAANRLATSPAHRPTVRATASPTTASSGDLVDSARWLVTWAGERVNALGSPAAYEPSIGSTLGIVRTRLNAARRTVSTAVDALLTETKTLAEPPSATTRPFSPGPRPIGDRQVNEQLHVYREAQLWRDRSELPEAFASVMPLPELGRRKYLPPGMYTASWSEFERQFGRGSRRSGMVRTLREAARFEHRERGAYEILVGGSFTTNKRLPGDVDAAVLYDQRVADRILAKPLNVATLSSTSFEPVHFYDESLVKLFTTARSGRLRGLVVLDASTA